MGGTLNRHELRTILEYLDAALADLHVADAGHLLRESNATWRVRMARERLLDAVVQPVAIEMLEAA